MEHIEDKMFEFYFAPIPKWPGNKIDLERFKEDEPEAEEQHNGYERRLSYASTVADITKTTGLSAQTVKTTINRGLRKLEVNMQLFYELKNMLLRGESIDEVDLKAMAKSIKSNHFCENVLYLKETTNFFNHNIGVNTWLSIKSLSQA